MLSLVRWIVLSAGWQRRLTALVAGATGALALAPIDSVPAMIVPMTVAVWLIDGSARGESDRGWARVLQPRSCWSAAAVGWWWGLGYFVAGFWWLGSAFLVDPGKDAWALPFGVLGVPAALACYPAAGFALARLFWSPGVGRIFALAAGLGASEWLRERLFTGFPWNNYGMAFGDHLVLSQAASLVGNPGLTLLAILVCATPATLADPPRASGAKWAHIVPTVFAALAVVVLAGFGFLRLSGDPGLVVAGVRLRIMQPNIPQNEEFSYANKDKILADYLDLSDRATSPDRAGLADVTHLIWPESAFPFVLSRDPEALESIGKVLSGGTLLITGAARVDAPEPGVGKNDEPAYFNAIEVVGPGGTILDNYDKVHLVPFGEYLPYDSFLRHLGLSNFVHIPGGFTPGLQRRLLDIPGLPPVAPSVCYEAIFSQAVLPTGPESERRRAGVILNVTNDSWFGRTAGPYQHFAQARLRTVEYGLPLIRAANSGISAVVDAYGRVTASLPLGVRNVLDASLPQRIPPTLYARASWIIEPAIYLGFLLLGFASGCIGRLSRNLD